MKIEKMNHWGFSLHTENHIDLNRKNKIWYELILQAEPSLLNCIGCGSCTATCAVNHFTYLSMHKINIWLNRGEIDAIQSQLSKCMFCGKCALTCPRNVILLVFFNN